MKYLSILICVVASLTSFADDITPPEKKTLNEQYRELSAGADVYDGFRMVKLYYMDRFWKTVMDSVAAEQAARMEAEKSVASLKQEITALNAKVSEQKATMADNKFEREHISVFGKDFTKAGFITTSLMVSGILLTLLILAVISMRISVGAVKEAQQLYDGVSREFDEYKHNAVEKQIKLSRELQTQKNRLESLKPVSS